MDISKIIRESYEKRIADLTIKNARHFFVRALVIEDSSFYKDTVAACIHMEKTRDLNTYLRELSAKPHRYAREGGDYSEIIGERRRRREDLYEEFPTLPLINKALVTLAILKKFSLHEKYPLWNKLRLLIRDAYTSVPITSESVVSVDSSYAVNTVFHLWDMEIVDMREDLLKTTKLLIKKGGDLDAASYTSLVYTLTHIIIAASKYYENHVPEYEWISKYLSENVETIKKNVSDDVLAETALCFRLTETTDRFPDAYNSIRDILTNGFVSPESIPAKELNQREHVNSILALLFSEETELLTPPDLSSHRVFNT
jgi:predicted RecB family endonuclease